jgi:hypothetical protein
MDVTRTGRYAAVLAAVVVLLYMLDLGQWTLLTNDEARFPAMARDIVARGRWLAPAIAGTPMLNKPPLHAWLIALVSLPGGAVTPRTSAIPSVVGALGNTELYGNLPFGGKIQMTGGSSGTASSWERYRRAGATARAMLIAAAAESWKVPGSEIKAENGIVSHASGKSATYGALAASAASGSVPANVALKEPSEWKYISNEALPRYDSAPKSNGRQQYTIDLREPGMLTAVMIHPPLFGATLKSFDASKAKSMKGVVDVVATPRGVAVIATGMWEAMKAREAVNVDWEDDKAEKRSSREIVAQYRAAADKGGEDVAANVGDVDAAFAKAAKLVEARYEFPYLAHAPLEPINAAARMNADGTLEVWGGHQMPDVYQAVAAKVAGIAPDKVIMRVMKTGGGFGRRASVDSDIIVEAVATAKAMGWKAPVKVQWTREDDMRAGRYRPAFIHKMTAALDDTGNLIALRDTLVGQSIGKDSFMEKSLVKNGVDRLSVEGMANQPYAIPNLRVEDNPFGTAPEIVDLEGSTAALTESSNEAHEPLVRRFVMENAALYGLTPEQVGQLQVVADYTNPAGNLSWVEYEQRIEKLEEMEWPKPNRDFIYETFNAFADRHPWVGEENIRPKSIAREMFENFRSFAEYVLDYELQRSEGLLLRHLNSVYKVLSQTVPDGVKTDEVGEMELYLRTLLRQVDSSLEDEWERMRDPNYQPRAQTAEVRPPGAAEAAQDITHDAKTFTGRFCLDDTLLYEHGGPVPFDAKAVSRSLRENRDTQVELSLSEGTGQVRFWTTDLTA